MTNPLEGLDKLTTEMKIEIVRIVLTLQNEQIKMLLDRIDKLEQYNKDKELI